MDINLRFTRYSLLYGHSLCFIASSLVLPLYCLPNLEGTKNRHALADLPAGRQIMSLYNLANRHRVAPILVKITLLVQILFAIIVLISQIGFSHAFSVNMLAWIDANSLSFKTVYFTPIMVASVNLVISILAYIDDKSIQTLWTLYDQCDIFSIKRSTQAWIMLFTISSMLPDSLLYLFDMILRLEYIRTGSFIGHDLCRDCTRSSAGPTPVGLYSILAYLNFGMIFIRYFPFINMNYVAICLSKHLKLITKHLADNRTKIITANNIRHSWAGELTGDKSRLAIVSDRDSYHARRLSDSVIYEEHGIYARKRATSLLANDHEGASEKYTGSKEKSMLVVSTKIDAMDHQPNWSHTLDESHLRRDSLTSGEQDRYITISNIKQLEHHLLRLNLLIKDMDQFAPSIIVLTCTANLANILYSSTYIRCSPREAVQPLVAFFYLSSRVWPVVLMFVSGSMLIKQARGLSKQLEIIYLRGLGNKNTSVLHKPGLDDNSYSLYRIFRLLNRFKFNCDHTMDLHLGTLRRCTLYLVTAFLIVIQYDFLDSKLRALDVARGD